MGVRVRLRLETTQRSVETSALINSGFESTEPEVIVPPSLAEELGLAPSSELSSYSVAGGGSISAIRSSTPIKVALVLEDRETATVEAIASILPGENEVIVSDRLAHELALVILDPFNGTWCLRDELGVKERQSSKPESWD